MAQVFPGTLNAFSNPAGTNTLPGTESGGQAHATQHSDANDAIEAHEAVLGTTAGTSVLKNFAAGQFPVRSTGGGATGTLVQTSVGGTFNSSVLGTPSIVGGSHTSAIIGATGGTINNITVGTPTITGGTSTAMTVIGTDILRLAGLLGTSGIQFIESSLAGSIANTTFNNGTNVGSIIFTPQVAIKPLIFCSALVDVAPTANRFLGNLTVNGTSFGAGTAANLYFLSYEDPVTPTTNSLSNHYYGPELPANTAATVIIQAAVASAGTARIFRQSLLVIPLPSA